MAGPYPYRIYPLGDSAITLDFGNRIDEAINKYLIAFFYSLLHEPLPGMLDAIPAYSSLTIAYDAFAWRKVSHGHGPIQQRVIASLENRLATFLPGEPPDTKHISIPVCYDAEFGPDLAAISGAKGLPVEELISLHCSSSYRVYMLGFLPGFTYMGLVDKRLEMPRQPQPRARVEAGSVGIAGRQTGIYPLPSPGGWQLIGRTPLKLFTSDFSHKDQGEQASGDEATCLLHPGDTVQFFSISRDEFENY